MTPLVTSRRVATVALLTSTALAVAPSTADAAPSATAKTTRPAPASTTSAAVVDAARPTPARVGVSERRTAFRAPHPTGRGLRAAARGAAAPVGDPLTPVVPVADVSVVGATWQHGTGDDTRVEYRQRIRGTWGDWRAASRGDCPACADGEEDAPGTREGSAAISVVGADAVQARLVTPAGVAPRDARFSVIDPGVAATDRGAVDVRASASPEATGTASAATTATTAGSSAALSAGSSAAPAASAANARWVRSRASWGAKAVRANGRFRPVAVAVHHTDGTNAYAPAQVPAILRGIQAFHRFDRGWNDIGYNALVDRYGRVWEGRKGGLDRPTVGAHASGFNDRIVGISVMGDFDRVAPPAAAVRGVAWAAGRVARNVGFDPRGRVTMKGTRYYRVIGHRNVGQTTCPGARLYAKLPTIRSLAWSYYH